MIVGGPNGSGKTTLALEYADELALPYVSADAIAEALNPLSPDAARIAAGRQFRQAVARRITQRESFVCESTLSGLTMQKVLASAQDAGYMIMIAFLFVDSADVGVARVAERVRKGGHDVPEGDIRRRFPRSIVNFWRKYRLLADSWVLLHNGSATLHEIALGSRDQISLRHPGLFEAFLGTVGEHP